MNDSEFDIHTVTFTSYESFEGSTNTVERTINGASTYVDVCEAFVYFIQSIGYNYIGGLTVLDEAGEPLHTTSF